MPVLNESRSEETSVDDLFQKEEKEIKEIDLEDYKIVV